MATSSRKWLALGIAALVLISVLILFFSSRNNATTARAEIRIALVGDSITEGSGYPAKLQRLLGPDFSIGNFGVSGSTVSLESGMPYMDQQAFRKSKNFQPSIVVIMLGTNDASDKSRESNEDFSVDLRKLVGAYEALEGDQIIWLVKPPPIFNNNLSLNNTDLAENVIPCIEQVAADLNLTTVDVNNALANYPQYFGDGVHPNDDGAAIIANEIGDALTPDSLPIDAL